MRGGGGTGLPLPSEREPLPAPLFPLPHKPPDPQCVEDQLFRLLHRTPKKRFSVSGTEPRGQPPVVLRGPSPPQLRSPGPPAQRPRPRSHPTLSKSQRSFCFLDADMHLSFPKLPIPKVCSTRRCLCYSCSGGDRISSPLPRSCPTDPSVVPSMCWCFVGVFFPPPPEANPTMVVRKDKGLFVP